MQLEINHCDCFQCVAVEVMHENISINVCVWGGGDL